MGVLTLEADVMLETFTFGKPDYTACTFRLNRDIA